MGIGLYMLAFAWFACVLPEMGVRDPPRSADPTSADPPTTSPSGSTPLDTADTAGATTDTDVGPCPTGMVAPDTSYCIDAHEAHLDGLSPYDVPSAGIAVSEPGVVPQGYISGLVAAEACRAAGKRLCTRDEWTLACRGAADRLYPYGGTYLPGACNEGRALHPVIELFGASADWSSAQMNDPRLNQLPDSLALTGSHPDCATPDGVYDLHGNLHEWVDDPAGTFLGGFYVDASLNGVGCTYATTAHTSDYHDYSTGFRCCADASGR